MAEFKFCPDCGAPRAGQAAFCTQCGRRLTQPSQMYLAYTAIVVLAVTVAIYAGIRYGMKDKVPVSAMPADHPPMDSAEPAAEHRHEDSPAVVALKQKAASGDVAVLMDLTEALLQQSAQDSHYLAEAAQTLERVVKGYPEHGYALRLLGNIYYGLQESALSVHYYERYLALHPTDANVHTDLGTQYLAMENTDKAIEQFQKAISLFPDFYNAYYNMSIAYQHAGNQAKADECKAKAQAIESTHGKKLAEDIELPRLPSGPPVANMALVDPASGAAAPAAADATTAAAPAEAPAEAAPVAAPTEAALAEVAPVAAPTEAAPAEAAPAGSLVSNGIDYAPLEAFFKAHQIIGPKMRSFHAENGRGILTVADFPMDKMPPMVRGQLETKINNMLTVLGAESGLEIRDQADGRVMMVYGKH